MGKKKKSSNAPAVISFKRSTPAGNQVMGLIKVGTIKLKKRPKKANHMDVNFMSDPKRFKKRKK